MVFLISISIQAYVQKITINMLNLFITKEEY